MYTYCKLFSPFLFPTLPVKELKKELKCQQIMSTENVNENSQPFYDSSAI